jgi:replicative DNA helicase
MFRSASQSAHVEIDARRNARKGLRRFGIQFLDDALLGVSPSDLVLIGAPSGVGKTQLCCNIALANMREGKRVHFMALEAEEFEIERRIKYQIFANAYYEARKRGHPAASRVPTYDRWVLGDFIDELMEFELFAAEQLEKHYKDLFLFYKQDRFTVANLIENVVANASESDLFIIDHVHYFDFDDDNENRAMREIAKTVRSLALEEGKPIILVAHLRKRDKQNEELVPGIDEFHGSSDLTKIATKVITIAPGGRTADGCFETFFRIPKNRMNGGVTRFIGRVMFDPKRNQYETTYKVGRAGLTKKTGFEEFAHDLNPEWATRPK